MSLAGKSTDGGMSSTTQQLKPLQVTSKDKPVVVGLYGVPGSGKTTLIGQLKRELGHDSFAYYEGSEVIANLFPGGLAEFKKLKENHKTPFRNLAIKTIGEQCTKSGKTGIVTGHYMFWDAHKDMGNMVCTQRDLDTYTHIIYLDVPPSIVAARREKDAFRKRSTVPATHLSRWQEAEKDDLRRLCRENGILFTVVSPPESSSDYSTSGSSQILLKKIAMLLRDFQCHTEDLNLSRVEDDLEKILAQQDQIETMVIMDADRTLTAVDTGNLFWKRASETFEDPLKVLFSGPLGYSFTAFRQAVLLYEETASDQEFDALCQTVASEVKMYPELVSLLHLIAKQDHVRAIIITCGLRRVWEKVLEREGLSETVGILGGGRIRDGYVVTAATKAAIVDHLKVVHRTKVWAFGDSPLDLEMLRKADEAVVVTGEEGSRSRTMDAELTTAIDNGLRARQVVLPSTATPRLDTTTLPLVQLGAPETINSILARRTLRVFHATDKNAAKLLMTPTRDASVSGPTLREAHRRVGWYLSTEFISDLIGVEQYDISHVQGDLTDGYRLLNERKTSIVALMRGGEPMALGVSDAFPLALFLHAKNPDDLKLEHLQGRKTIVLVDSVVNSGKTIVEFVNHIYSLHPTIRIVVVAGVVQSQCIAQDGSLEKLALSGDLSLVALRLSENKYTGKGSTDTGNRLFNTTHID